MRGIPIAASVGLILGMGYDPEVCTRVVQGIVVNMIYLRVASTAWPRRKTNYFSRQDDVDSLSVDLHDSQRQAELTALVENKLRSLGLIA